MKPIVSSLVALALAVAPMTAFAKPHKAKTHKVEKAEKSDSEKAPIIRVKAGKKDGSNKNAIHHAHNVDLSGAGHKEPASAKEKNEGAMIKASLKTPIKKADKDLPSLPNPKAGKPSKGGAEKGARKASEKKHESSGDDNSGEPARDEDTAELVARIRGSEPSIVKAKHAVKTAPCLKEPVEVIRGPEMERFELTTCEGKIAPLAIEHLSIAIRPGGAARPTAPLTELAKKPGDEIAPHVRRVDPRLVERLQTVIDHFDKPGAAPKLFIISGYRPASVGSKHSSGKAIDLRLDGVKNEEVVAFCKTLDDTGCGYYPNSSFVHIDVREPGSGHVTWIDASGPGQAPHYVTSWPLRSDLDRTSTLAAEGAQILRAERPDESDTSPDLAPEHSNPSPP